MSELAAAGGQVLVEAARHAIEAVIAHADSESDVARARRALAALDESPRPREGQAARLERIARGELPDRPSSAEVTAAAAGARSRLQAAPVGAVLAVEDVLRLEQLTQAGSGLTVDQVGALRRLLVDALDRQPVTE